MPQLNLFDSMERLTRLDKLGERLARLSAVMDWELFRPTLLRLGLAPDAHGPGRAPWDEVLMFKILVLQHLHNLSDDATELMLVDRLSWQRFVGLHNESDVPDAKTIWLFRQRINRAGLERELFETFEAHLVRQGLSAKGGSLVDATFVEVPIARNTRQENEIIKQNQVPEAWQAQPHKLRQKDCDARWTKKGGRSYFGYKNHIKSDEVHGFIRRYEVTAAHRHDSQVMDQLLTPEDKQREVFADSAYTGEPIAKLLASLGAVDMICEKAFKGRDLNEGQKAFNRLKSSVRSAVEHIFGFMTQSMGGIRTRVIGLRRNSGFIGLNNLVFNLCRYEQILRLRSDSLAPGAC